jgi:hypothetical protein
MSQGIYVKYTSASAKSNKDSGVPFSPHEWLLGANGGHSPAVKGQGADLLETRVWDDRASGVIEV